MAPTDSVQSRHRLFLGLLALCVLLSVAALNEFAPSVQAGASTLYLRVRCAVVRAKPAQASDAKGWVFLGQPMERQEKRGGWARVKYKISIPPKKEGDKPEEKDEEGWLREAALIDKAPALEKTERYTPSALARGTGTLPPDGGLGKARFHAEACHQDLTPVLEMELEYPAVDQAEQFQRDGKIGLYREDWPLPDESKEAKHKP